MIGLGLNMKQKNEIEKEEKAEPKRVAEIKKDDNRFFKTIADIEVKEKREGHVKIRCNIL